MPTDFAIRGYAIVSVEGMIADADKAMPSGLKYEADHRFFEAALADVDLILHGRQSHEGFPSTAKVRRFWLTRSVAALEPDPAGGPQWLWNPKGITLEAAAESLGLTKGVVAVLGGTSIYDLFLPNYDSFSLSRAGKTHMPGGTPVFSAVRNGLTPEQILAGHGLSPEPTLTLDADNDVTMTRWRRG
jgi:dihydrofolate reductase